MIVRYVLAWLPMTVIGIANGVLREATYGKRLSELRAHQVSTATGVVLFGLYVWGLSRLWPLQSGGPAIAVGLLWIGLTVLFEFGFGHWVAGHTWHELLRDYDLLAGRVWVLLLLWIGIAPWVFHHLGW
jgi:hypothetical protein